MKKVTPLLFISLICSFLFSSYSEAEQGTALAANLHEQNTMSVLWFQTSGEAKALYYQGYNIGKMRLNEFLCKQPKKRGLKPPAIVLDIDETILDNSPHQAWNVKAANGHFMNWDEWINRFTAKPLPGAVDFLKYAHSKGVEIYYISNRKEAGKAATIRNLKQIGAPMADAAHVLLLQPGERGKENRRQQVARIHDIVLLFGDNLGDFSGFDYLSPAGRVKAVEQRKEEFGKKLIVFPNPMYGDWEGAIYNYNHSKSDFEKANLRKANLQQP